MLQSNVQFSLMLLALPLAHVIAQDEDATTKFTEACGCKRRLAARLHLYTAQFETAVQKKARNELAAAKYALAAHTGNLALREPLITIIVAAAVMNSRCQAELAAEFKPTLEALEAGAQTIGIYLGINALTKVGCSFKTAPEASDYLPIVQLTRKDVGTTSKLEGAEQTDCVPEKAPSMVTEDTEAPLATMKLHSKVTAKCQATGSNTCFNAQMGSSGNTRINLAYETTKPEISTNCDASTHSANHVLSTNEIDLKKRQFQRHQ
uniref:Variant surface glycoprotein 1874 n=1 Tax=Trypanosoma brucei TaxID=5691 RepID=M4SZJ9_9TRYP|nr:variant surface glycoprotein 1874 [Trypanosoma brucei]